MPGQAPPLTNERELLLAYVDQQRDGIRFAAYGLTDDQARLAPTAGTLSIGGLVKHVTAMEQSWMDTVLQRSSNGSIEESADSGQEVGDRDRDGGRGQRRHRGRRAKHVDGAIDRAGVVAGDGLRIAMDFECAIDEIHDPVFRQTRSRVELSLESTVEPEARGRAAPEGVHAIPLRTRK